MMADFAELNTNKSPSVSETIEFLKQYPPDWFVNAYEGEGGSWILVSKEKL